MNDRTEHQFSSGGVVIKKEKNGIMVLLIKDKYGHWTWPKGHIEPGETKEQAAIREISEETSVKSLEIVKELGKQEYYFTFKGKKIFKTVHIFLLRSIGKEKLAGQKDEVEDVSWFTPQAALEKIEYKGSVTILEKGINEFNEKFSDKQGAV